MNTLRYLALALALLLALTPAAPRAAAEGLDALQGMLDDLSGAPPEDAAPEDPPGEVSGAPAPQGAPGYADYALLEGYLPATLNDTVLVQVPADWGNNAGDRALTSYSPVNGSGAISPNAGTLSTNWFSVDTADPEAVLRDYAQRIGSKKIVSGLQAAQASVAGQPGSLLTYGMDVGANHFDVCVLCFAYQGNIYSLDLTQGARSETDYRPVFDAASGTFAIYDETWDIDDLVRRARPAPTPEPAPTEAPAPAPEPVPTPESLPAEPAVQPGAGGDLGGFTYAVNGHEYRFPTRVSDMAGDDLPIDRSERLPYDLSPAAADNGGVENPLVNTQFYAYSDPASMELIGVANLTGREAALDEGVVTALVDAASGEIRLSLPGGVEIGAPESAVVAAFPEFSGRALDGLAGFRGNELLYACNVRSDGSHGYALIRNDAPYFSVLTLVCDGGAITEINFECLGAALANGIFL